MAIIASRRRFLFGASASLLVAPAIVRVAAHLMPISTAAQHDYHDLIVDIGRELDAERRAWYVGNGRPPSERLKQYADRYSDVVQRASGWELRFDG
jgi:hypothetical protein